MLKLIDIPREVFINNIFSGFKSRKICAISITSKEYYALFIGEFKKLWERRMSSPQSVNVNTPMTLFEFIGGRSQFLENYHAFKDLFRKNEHLFSGPIESEISRRLGVVDPKWWMNESNLYNPGLNYADHIIQMLNQIKSKQLEASKDIRSLEYSRFYFNLLKLCIVVFSIVVFHSAYVLFTDPNCDPLGFRVGDSDFNNQNCSYWSYWNKKDYL